MCVYIINKENRWYHQIKSDDQFYSLFKEMPELLLEVFGLETSCKYRLKSVVLKEMKKEMDGLLIPEKNDYPSYVVEVQGYKDHHIYKKIAWKLITASNTPSKW